MEAPMPFCRFLARLAAASLLLCGTACQSPQQPAPGPSLACCWVLDPLPGNARVAVEGLALNEAGQPLPGLSVLLLRCGSSGQISSERVDGKGRFSFSADLSQTPLCLVATTGGDGPRIAFSGFDASRAGTFHVLLVLTDATAPPVTILTDDREPDLLSPSLAS